MIMKKFMLSTLLLICGIMVASAQAEIKFDKTTHNFGKFSESSPVVTCTFTFTNTGDKPLLIIIGATFLFQKGIAVFQKHTSISPRPEN